jgi:hypothetical protein
MTAALSVIALLSLATTGALLVYIARLLRDERDRAEARVAVLSSAIWRDEGRNGDVSTTVARELELDKLVDASHRDEHDSYQIALGDTSDFVGGVESTSMFADREGASGLGVTRRWVVPAIGVGVVGIALLAVALMNTEARRRGSVATTTDETLQTTPLELLSLRHARDEDSLRVSGLVRNPPSAVTHNHMDVVVFAFDAAGTFITSMRASLADPVLGSGAESPFTVTIPHGGRVNRYRVSFRTGDRVLPHIDRRQASAARVSPNGQQGARTRGDTP